MLDRYDLSPPGNPPLLVSCCVSGWLIRVIVKCVVRKEQHFEAEAREDGVQGVEQGSILDGQNAAARFVQPSSFTSVIDDGAADWLSVFLSLR